MPTILAIDTATEACSAAIYHHHQFDTIFEIAPQQHSHLILPMIQQLLNKHRIAWHEISAIAFGAGPGSFTGLRIAAGVAQGLALSHQIPLIAISDLAALAAEAFEACPQINFCIPAIDARMAEIYLGCYQQQTNHSIIAKMDDQLIKPQNSMPTIYEILVDEAWVAIGSGWDVYYDLLLSSIVAPPLHLVKQAFPSALSIAKLAVVAFEKQQFVNIETALPHYLRNDVVHKKNK